MTAADLNSKFAHWLEARVGAPVDVGPFEAPGHGGFSNETLLTTAEWNGHRHGLVLRLAPEGRRIFPKYDLTSQSRVLEALGAHTDIPVPEVLWSEHDRDVLGREFYVMERIDGRIPPDRPGYQFEGWVKDASPDEQSRVLDAGLEVMARIHRVDWERAGLGFLDRAEHGTGALDQELGYWRAYLDWASGETPVDALETILEWCATHRPPEPSARGLVWGDARLGNLIYADDLSVRAVMDWEMAVLGPAELDLGWFVFLDQMALQFTDPLPGFIDRDAMVAEYERHLGRELEHFDWYEIWGGFRAACIQVPLFGTVDNPVSAELLRRIG